MDNGWEDSAAAWIASQGDAGDFSRAYVLDDPMLARVRAAKPPRALDVGCGEGRFVRMLKAEGIDAVGLDPTPSLIAQARRLDPDGVYLEARAESLPFADESFDLVVSYLSLVDIEDYHTGIAEMVRVLSDGGVLLVANPTSLNTARVADADQRQGFVIDNYMQESARWEAWRGIRIKNHHRPLSAYMQAFLGHGLTLTHFDEPRPKPGGDPIRTARYGRMPWHLMMEWRKG